MAWTWWAMWPPPVSGIPCASLRNHPKDFYADGIKASLKQAWTCNGGEVGEVSSTPHAFGFSSSLLHTQFSA